MIQAIWKFELRVTDVQTIEMPAGARVLTVAAQGPALMLWAEVDPSAPVKPLTVRVVGTGFTYGEWRERAGYLGTAQVGPFVWHVFAESYGSWLLSRGAR